MYDFDRIMNQRNTQDEKHDQLYEYFGRDDLLPMWVAEMDFQSAPVILNALIERVKHGIFGYTYRSEEYQLALIDWYAKRHNVAITKKMIAYDTGVLKSIFEMLRIFSHEGDRVCVPEPAYPQFEKVITLANRKIVHFPLNDDNHRYYFDFALLDKVLKTCQVLILCSPHNPGGRIWEMEELKQIALCCEKYNVLLICDEIHCDLTMRGEKFISMLSISSKCIVMNSISKPFNLAGLQHSYSICQNDEMGKKIASHYHMYKIKSMNTLSMLAQVTAYRDGALWLEECCDYILDNDAFIRDFIQKHALQLPVFTLQAGYLLWIDFAYYFNNGEELNDFLVNTCHIATTQGSTFGYKYRLFTRLNIATQKIHCEKAMIRIYEGLKEKGFVNGK